MFVESCWNRKGTSALQLDDILPGIIYRKTLGTPLQNHANVSVTHLTSWPGSLTHMSSRGIKTEQQQQQQNKAKWASPALFFLKLGQLILLCDAYVNQL